MEQRLSLVTLGVDDLARARRFYETGLGWAPAAVHEGVTFYQLTGIAFALWDRAEMAAEVPVPAGNGFGGVTIAVNQRSEADVDAALAAAAAAGGTVLRPAEHTDWGGYSGYFADPDGHVWEVAVNPAWTVNADGTLTI